MTQFTIEQVEDGSQSVYVISPSGRYLTENSFTGSYDLVEEPTSDSIFVVEDLEDNFVSKNASSRSFLFKSLPSKVSRRLMQVLSQELQVWSKLNGFKVIGRSFSASMPPMTLTTLFQECFEALAFFICVLSSLEANLKPSELTSTLTVHLKPRSTFTMVLPDTSQSGKLFPIRKTFLPCLSNKSILSGIHVRGIILCTTY